jgi:hypothetical protein
MSMFSFVEGSLAEWAGSSAINQKKGIIYKKSKYCIECSGKQTLLSVGKKYY